MQKGFLILMLGLLGVGCSSETNAQMFHPWGWENIHQAKTYLGQYRHVFVARLREERWEPADPHHLTPHRFKGTVITSYKGDWKVAEQISFVHYVDARPPLASGSNNPSQDLVFVFANEHTNLEFALETGEWGYFRTELAPALEHLFPVSRTSHDTKRR